MTLSYHHLLPILYHPVSYCHVSHLPAGWPLHCTTSLRLANYWLINEFRLPEQEEVPCNLTPLHMLLLQNWYQIPQIAQLTGAWLLRQPLCSGGKLHQLSRQQQQFITLPLGIDSPQLAEGTTPAQAGAMLLQVQLSGLPAAITQRVRLHFPDSLSPGTVKSSIFPFAGNLTRMAINYADSVRN